MTETDRYTVFADSEPVMISLCLSDIPQGSYKISETYEIERMEVLSINGFLWVHWTYYTSGN